LGPAEKNTNFATKLTEVVKEFYNSNLKSHANYVTKENFTSIQGREEYYHHFIARKSPMKPGRNLQIAVDNWL
jgi:hypothetical protein